MIDEEAEREIMFVQDVVTASNRNIRGEIYLPPSN
jgi:hypothetical protein